MGVRDQRSGGCEVAAGSGSLPQIAAGWALGSGPGLPTEESDACVLESKNRKYSLTASKQHLRPDKTDYIYYMCSSINVLFALNSLVFFLIPWDFLWQVQEEGSQQWARSSHLHRNLEVPTPETEEKLKTSVSSFKNDIIIIIIRFRKK